MKLKKKILEYNIEDLKRYMRLSAKKKLQYLEEMNKFLSAAIPQENKEIWEKMKAMGW